MRLRTSIMLGLVLVLGAGQASAQRFLFECPTNRYLSLPLGTSHQFASPIQALPAGNARVDVTFTPHFPDGWTARWSLRSSGLYYTGNQQVNLLAGLPDRLDVDVFPAPGIEGYGWVDVSIRATEDPLEVAVCTYTLYSGMPVLETDWSIDCTDNTINQDAPAYFEFHNPLVNRLMEPDTLLAFLTVSLPPEWDMHFHHGGICYFPAAQIPLHPAGMSDSLIVMGAPSSSGVGAGELMLQSKRNPSIFSYCHYRVMVRAPEGSPSNGPAGARVRVAPNPSVDAAAFFLHLPDGSAGRLSIFGPDGRLVRSFPEIVLAGGNGALRWDGRDDRGAQVPPGVYFYRFGSGENAPRGTLIRVRS